MESNHSLLKSKVVPDGPFLVQGKVEIVLADGKTESKDKPALCRCGASRNKPYCDGSHIKIGFKG